MSFTKERITVLHVDDELDFAELAAEFLEQHDDRLDVQTSTSAQKGLDLLANSDVDCIVSDYNMPDMDGIEFLEAIREDHPDIPFILFTGKGSEEVASEAISAGATDYLQKESGTEQYELLANRIRNAVEQYKTQQHAVEIERIRSLITDINQALIRADSQSAAETRVCEIISESDPYLFAWIGDVGTDTDRVEPRTWAGVEEGYLNEITLTTDETATGRGPTGTALREQRVAVSQKVAEDPKISWREAALDRGYQAMAAVPLEYGDTLYGGLNVYADRPYAFTDDEKELLAELGADIGHALHSFEIQETLREERKFIDQALNALDDGFYVLGPNGEFRRWNDRIIDVTGYTEAELADMEAIDLFPEEEQASVAAGIEEALTTGEAVVEADLLTANGDRISYEFSGSRLLDSDGDPIGLIGISRDITERKERTRRLSTLISNLPGIVYRARNEPEWPMEFVKGDCESITGYAAELLEEGEVVWGRDILHPDDKQKTWEAVQTAIEEERPFEITYRIRTKDGTTKWMWERGQFVESWANDSQNLEGFITDITERKQHEVELQQERARLNALFQHTIDPVAYIEFADGEPIVQEVNPSFEETFGYDEKSAIGRSMDELVFPDTVDETQEAAELNRRTETGELVETEVRRQTVDGVRNFLLQTVPLEPGQSGTRSYVIYSDITERKEREWELARMNDLFEQAQKIADLGAWETDLRDDKGWWTEQVNQIYGLPQGYEPGPGEGIEYFHPEDKPVIRDAFERAKEAGEPYDLELRVVDDEDGFKWIRTRGKPKVENGEVVGIRGTIQDITDRKSRQIELERTNTLLSTLFGTLPHGVLAEDESRKVLATNDRLLNLLDLPGNPEDVIGADCERFATEVSDRFVDPEFVERINQVISERAPIDAEELELTDGRTFERSYRPIELPDGEGNLWVYTDITARKEQQQELETILERMNDSVFVHGEDSTFMFVNETAIQRYGYSEEEFSSMKPRDVNAAEHPDEIDDRVKRVKEAGELVFETVHEHASGETLPVEVNATMITFRGKPAILSIVRDISKRKQQERKLRQQNERLDKFASVVSHDLRNPLNVAQGRIDLAKKDCDSDHLEDAAKGIDRSLELIDDMLKLARAGESVGNIEPVVLDELIQRCWGNVKTEDATVEAETDLSICADKTRLQQLLENLLRNAIEHGGDRLTIEIGGLPDGFYVQDDGIGIPEEKREKIFTAGYSSVEDGTGFGLSIVKEIVDAHGWDISVGEGFDGGTRFEITGVEFATE